MVDEGRAGSYRCTECGAVTGASTLPSYCPACETWGSMTTDREGVAHG